MTRAVAQRSACTWTKFSAAVPRSRELLRREGDARCEMTDARCDKLDDCMRSGSAPCGDSKTHHQHQRAGQQWRELREEIPPSLNLDIFVTISTSRLRFQQSVRKSWICLRCIINMIYRLAFLSISALQCCGRMPRSAKILSVTVPRSFSLHLKSPKGDLQD